MLRLGLGLAAACQGFGPPASATLQRLRPMPIAAAVPTRFELELESSVLTGVFDAVLATEPAGFGLQLFPDVGAKVFELVVSPQRIVATTPAGGYAAAAPFDAAAPHLALLLAAAFAELLAPVPAGRVLGERPAADGRVEVLLQPALGAGRVTAGLGADGAIVRYAIELGRLHFTLDAAGALRAPGLRAQLRWPEGG
jgi:hypothetical protein